MKKILFFLFIIAAPGVFGQTEALPSFLRDSLDGYVEKGMSSWQIPGVAVCVVRDGKVVLMKGYGVREMGGGDKVDENTLFMIGSNTKAFTATALAILDDEKKLSLNDKVQKWLPTFTQYDPWVAKEAIVRDLLCHRLGFETFQGDFMYFDSDLTTEEVMEKFGRVKPKYGFREKWGYCNAAFMVAGQIIPKITGKTWATYIKEKLFVPLGMNRSLSLSSEILTATNKASAHTVVEGKLRKIPYGHIDNLAPAGSISSSVMDMSKWVMMQLNNGKLEGREIVDGGVISETRNPNSIVGGGNHELYGLGWFLENYHGKEIVSHTGGVNGFVTSVTLLPQEHLGIVVLTNTDANNFYVALKDQIVDAYLKLPYKNYSEASLSRRVARERQVNQELKLKQDSIASHPKSDLSLSAYAGTYLHDVYGKMTISLENGLLVARFEHHKGRFAALSPLGGSRFWANFNDPLYGQREWPFSIENGKVRSVTVTVADFVEFTPYEFFKQ